MNSDLEQRSINTIRFLAADAIQQANSGHPGLPMGCAAIAYVIWTRHLRHNPSNPSWFDRDRFVLSGGHGSMLLYALLHLTGYALSLDELRRFRQSGSLTPGHPEYGLTPGVEVTTGPLGQGFSNGVGLAVAEAHLASLFNRPGHGIVDHTVYAIVTDGDLMEGITAEAASFAGHQKLGKLIYLYDDNHVSIDGPTEIAFTEDCAARFAAYGWHVSRVEDGNDLDRIDAAIRTAKADPRPSLILCRTKIGFGMPNRQGTSKAHGEPPGEEELEAARENLGWPREPRFFIPEDVLAEFRQALQRGADQETEWKNKLAAYRKAFPEQAAELERRIAGALPENWQSALEEFAAGGKPLATRVASGKIINQLAARLPELVGGSADLAPSTKTWIDGSPAFQEGQRDGRNFHFGVREHAMGAIVNGMAVHGGVIPFGATFLTFADYMRTPLRLSAMSHYPSIWVFTHDSIGVGEDGPTHQPVEHLATLRAIPGLVVIRPADANETSHAWKTAIERRDGPTLLVLSRQDLPIMDRSQYSAASGVSRGAYILADFGTGKPELILMASGSEVSLIFDAARQLAADSLSVRVVSFPSWELFQQQSAEYRESVLPAGISTRLAVEAGISLGWERWVGDQGKILAIDRYGASAPYKEIYREVGLTVERIVAEARSSLQAG
jgi:transketolase